MSAAEACAGSFVAARAAFEQVIEFARQAAVDEITHGQLERELSTRMRGSSGASRRRRGR